MPRETSQDLQAYERWSSPDPRALHRAASSLWKVGFSPGGIPGCKRLCLVRSSQNGIYICAQHNGNDPSLWEDIYFYSAGEMPADAGASFLVIRQELTLITQAFHSWGPWVIKGQNFGGSPWMRCEWQIVPVIKRRFDVCRYELFTSINIHEPNLEHPPLQLTNNDRKTPVNDYFRREFFIEWSLIVKSVR